MYLYNTLSRKKEPFVPLDGRAARVYSCGPTVYNTATIGNLRAYIFTDVLKKTLEHAGFQVHDVMNVTDVGHLVTDADDGEDKVEKAARAGNTTPQAIAQKYTRQFFADCEKLNIRRPKIVAPATEYITEMMNHITALDKKGYTYITTDGVYFDSSKFPGYNKLNKMPLEKNKAGARVDLGEKRGPHDFALWKFVGDTTLQKWQFLDRWGCPGWHIECSAIARKHLGDTFDIHTGGIDHIPIHHTNEIAQTESLTGKPMSRFWLHNEFITIDNGKMSKSLGNAYTLADLESRGFAPLAYRYFCLLASYRTILNFTWEGLVSSQNAYNNLVAALAKHYAAAATTTDTSAAQQVCTAALLDDMNTPKVIAQIWEIIKQPASRQIYRFVIALDAVLSLDLEKAVKQYLATQNTTHNIPASITAIAEQRLTAKKNKDFAFADKLRAQITEQGYEITDTKEGFTLAPLK